MNVPERTRSPLPLPRQHNLEIAVEKAIQTLRRQEPRQLERLGARVEGGSILLTVLREELRTDLAHGRIFTSSQHEAGLMWRILVLHYLCVAGPVQSRPPEIAFADLSSARPYSGVYRARVVDRLCATGGTDGQALASAAAGLGGQKVTGPWDLAFELAVFPLITFKVIWRRADEEFPASAVLLLPQNIESFFVAEDIVVLSERLVSRLAGRPF
jgi:hypothetical protein